MFEMGDSGSYVCVKEACQQKYGELYPRRMRWSYPETHGKRTLRVQAKEKWYEIK